MLNRAIQSNNPVEIEEVKERIRRANGGELYFADGFRHPAILIYTKDKPNHPILARWGYVPEDVMNDPAGRITWTDQLISRGEKMFRTWSFRKSANTKRCVICVDGFYEHYHYRGKAYPYYIHRDDNQPMVLAGLWSESEDRESGGRLRTFSIVTTEANELLAKIHNKPLHSEEPRMPLILPEEVIDEWITKDIESESDKEAILKMVKPYPDKELKAYTVSPLKGKRGLGNVPGSAAPAHYPELDQFDDEPKQGKLF